LGKVEAVEGVSAYSGVFLIKKISQQNKTATNEHVFTVTYKPSLIEKQETLILLDCDRGPLELKRRIRSSSTASA